MARSPVVQLAHSWCFMSRDKLIPVGLRLNVSVWNLGWIPCDLNTGDCIPVCEFSSFQCFVWRLQYTPGRMTCRCHDRLNLGHNPPGLRFYTESAQFMFYSGHCGCVSNRPLISFVLSFWHHLYDWYHVAVIVGAFADHRTLQSERVVACHRNRMTMSLSCSCHGGLMQGEGCRWGRKDCGTSHPQYHLYHRSSLSGWGSGSTDGDWAAQVDRRPWNLPWETHCHQGKLDYSWSHG